MIYVNTEEVKLNGQTASKAEEKKLLWDEENRLGAISVNGYVSNYTYDADGERVTKLSGGGQGIFVNSVFSGGKTSTSDFTLYVNPYLVAQNGGRYTKHIYIGSQRIVSKLGDFDSYGADPRRVEKAGESFSGVKVNYDAKYKKSLEVVKANYDTFEVPYYGLDNNDYVNGLGFCCNPSGESVSGGGSSNPTGKLMAGKNDNAELQQFYYHPDHLGSSSYISNLDGEVVQHIEYVPFGEIFLEKKNAKWNTPYLFTSKELDRETGLYYFGARYQDPKLGIFLAVDKKAEEFAGWSSYNYTLNNPVRFSDPDGNGPLDIIFRGKNGNEIRVKTAGEDKILNLPFNIAKNKTIDIGIGNIDPSRFVYGYTVDVDFSLAAIGGAQWGGEISVARFTDSKYGGYNYVYAGGHINKTLGAQVSIAASAGGSIFFGYNDDKGQIINPTTFAGDSYTFNGSMDIKAIVGGGISVGAFSSVRNPIKEKGWKGFTLGFNVGVGGGGNLGAIGFQHSQTTLVNDIKSTSARSFSDRMSNAVAPIPSSIIQATYNVLNPE